MNDALVIARLGLAAVFILAVVAKLADRWGTRQALADFDVPRHLAGPLLLLLPAAELAAATALVFPTTARWGAAGSLVLLALFVVGLTQRCAAARPRIATASASCTPSLQAG